jgi:hypothetical protein
MCAKCLRIERKVLAVSRMATFAIYPDDYLKRHRQEYLQLLV